MKMNSAELSAITTAMSQETQGLTPEQLIAHYARISNPNNQHNTDSMPKLLLYLITNQHWSPFDMVTVTMKITTTRAIMAQVLRHWSARFQEFSQRYSTVEEMDFTGVQARMKAEGGNRQGSGDESDEWTGILQEWCAASASTYQAALEAGMAPECARMVLPLGVPTTAYVTASVRTMITYFWQRLDPHAQAEHRELAWAMFDEFEKQFPYLAELVLNYKPVVMPQKWCSRPGERDEQRELFPGKYPTGLPKMNDGEPWFLIRGQDKLAPMAVSYYATLLNGHDLPEQAGSVIRFSDEIEKWQANNPEKVKLPD